MLRAECVVPRDVAAIYTSAGTITLERAQRHRRRIAMTTDQGLPFILNLPEATYFPHGCGLALTNGHVVTVVAADEPLLEIRADGSAALARIAWHIGNRHTPAEVTAQAIYIQPDHVLEEMVVGLGAHVHQVLRPFEPEGGAYGGHGALQSGHHHHGTGPDHAHPHETIVPRTKPAIWRPD